MTAIEIIRGALETCGVIASGEAVSNEDAALCLGVLNRIIKLMPTHGFSWPKLTSTDASIAWVSGNSVSSPSDYFGVPVLDYTNTNGKRVPLIELTKADFDKLEPTEAAAYPTHFYVAPDATFKLYPTPTTNPNLKLSYQAIIADVTLTQTPSITIVYQDLLECWLADEISIKFMVPQNDRAEIVKRLGAKKEHALQWAVSMAPIYFEAVE